MAGILIAFGLNAWWEGQSADLITTDSLLEAVIERHVEKVGLYRGIVSLLGRRPSQTVSRLSRSPSERTTNS